MENLWQLTRISTGEALGEKQKLPENWGPIFGLHGFLDKLGDLSWLGEGYVDKGWSIVGEAPDDIAISTKAELEWSLAKKLLRESPEVKSSTQGKGLVFTLKFPLKPSCINLLSAKYFI